MAENKEKMNRIKIRLHNVLAFILLLHSLFFIVYWLSVGSFRPDVDQFLGDLIGVHFSYTTVIVVLYILVAFWSLLRFIRLRLAGRGGVWKPSAISWIYFGVWVLSLVGIYGGFWIILLQNPSQKGVLIHLLNLVRLVSDVVIFLFIASLLRRLILYLRRRHASAQGARWPWMAAIVAVLVALVAVWLVPAVFPPNWAYQGDLPTRPALVAHRGASMLAPENTIAAGELAAANQALGFETDVRISLDGVPFLMHDETLARTTNIAEVFPDRVNDDASSFTLDELKRLNAGLWFIQTDPFGTINDGLVSQSQLGIDQGQTIPTLEEALDMVRENGMVVLFDMREPSQEHPFYEEFFDIVLKTCLESGLNGNVWFLADEQHLETLLVEAPQMTRVVGVSSTDLPAPFRLLDQHYEIVNVDTGITTREIRAYRDQGLGVNVYTIDEPWLFSQFWLSGVTSVTTNNIHSFSQLEQPYLNLPYARYMVFWGLFGIVVAIWLAASQPEPEQIPARDQVQPDLRDFVTDDDDMVDTTQTPAINNDLDTMMSVEAEPDNPKEQASSTELGWGQEETEPEEERPASDLNGAEDDQTAA
jgi:glycerophosphoryl diester phosphodiesterase